MARAYSENLVASTYLAPCLIPGAIWFYCGNEANVELYINATGLMWENAEAAGALLVFAEHRYYGETLIFPGDQDKLPASKMHWLVRNTFYPRGGVRPRFRTLSSIPAKK